jgi:heme-degrading monooxygenase HmoA
MHARSKTFRLAPEKIADATSEFERDHLPQYRDQTGYKGFTLLRKRDSGEVTGISYWESESDRAASDELGRTAGEQMLRTGGGEGEVAGDEWEVLLDDMA